VNSRERNQNLQEGRLIGALLRVPYFAVTQRVYETLIASGFDDISHTHLIVFQNIDEKKGSRLTDLAHKSNMSKQAMAYLVNQLKACGYLEDLPDPSDGRARRLYLTARGAALVHLAIETVRTVEMGWTDQIGKKQMQTLKQILQNLVAVLEEPDPES
jgi:DNA-binding MarR family transcriptional regulator